MDYKEIIEELNEDKVINLLEKLEIPYQNKDDYILCKTMCHNIDPDDSSWKLYYYKDSHIFYCYTEDGAMSIFKFLEAYYKTRSIEYDWYKDVYKVALDCSNFRAQKFGEERYKSIRSKYVYSARPQLQTYPDGILDVFVKKYPIEWLEDGISKAAMDKFNILYSINQNKIIIPHYDIDGNLIGIRGRALNEWEIENIGKYAPVRIEDTWYSHKLSLNLYGLNINKKNIKRNRIVYLYESEKAVLQHESFSIDNCAVATCGSNFNKYQLKLLVEYCKPQEIVICYDKEEKKGETKYFQKLWDICKKYHNYCNFSFIYDSRGLLDMKDSPSDKGEKIFKQLLEKRVRFK